MVRNLTQLPRREGRRGSIEVAGAELVSGQSPGPNVAVNTKGSVYIGKSGARASAPAGEEGHGAPPELVPVAYWS